MGLSSLIWKDFRKMCYFFGIFLHMNQVVNKIQDNFYLRNLFLVFILTSVHVGSRSTSRDFNHSDIFISFMFAGWSYMAYMFHNTVVYEKLLKQRKYFLYLLSFIVLLVIHRQGYNGLMGHFQKIWLRLTTRGWVALYWLDTMYFMLALGVYLAFTYSRERERLLQVENEKKELELKELNLQLNPHFLFNALNNIYAHLLISSNNGKELILKLGELMRYILDSSKKKLVPVQDEISFIENYLAFSKERLGMRCDIQYTKTDESRQAYIVPLILFTFIENAFKHGTKDLERVTITITLNINDSRLKLYVSNPVTESHESSTNIGLTNTRRRLDILYPGSYTLDIKTSNGIYIAALEINRMS